MNMVKQARVENVIVKTDHKIDENGAELFFIGEVGREREALCFGPGKAKRLLAALMDDPEAFIDTLTNYVHGKEAEYLAARTPTKTIEVNDVLYGLFQDGTVKMRVERKGKMFWKAVTGRMVELLTPEAFDSPDTLMVPMSKVAKSPRTAKDDKINALEAGMAQMQAMMAQLLQAQLAGK